MLAFWYSILQRGRAWLEWNAGKIWREAGLIVAVIMWDSDAAQPGTSVLDWQDLTQLAWDHKVLSACKIAWPPTKPHTPCELPLSLGLKEAMAVSETALRKE